MLKKLQDRGLFRTIGDKLTGLFANKNKELPEANVEIPEPLLQESAAQKKGLRVPEEQDLNWTNVVKDSNTRTTNLENGNDVWQK